MKRIAFTITMLVTLAACGIARADYVTNHFPGGHGPQPVVGNFRTWGIVELFDTAGNGEWWLGNVDGAYVAYPTAGKVWVRKSAPPSTYAVAYEFSNFTGRTFVVTSSWNLLPWSPQALAIQYDTPCPITPGMAVAHACSGDWTPMDGGGVPTVVIGNGIVKPGLPYGDYLHYTADHDGPGSWCTANFSDYPGVTKPAGLPNHVVAVDACP